MYVGTEVGMFSVGQVTLICLYYNSVCDLWASPYTPVPCNYVHPEGDVLSVRTLGQVGTRVILYSMLTYTIRVTTYILKWMCSVYVHVGQVGTRVILYSMLTCGPVLIHLYV